MGWQKSYILFKILEGDKFLKIFNIICIYYWVDFCSILSVFYLVYIGEFFSKDEIEIFVIFY